MTEYYEVQLGWLANLFNIHGKYLKHSGEDWWVVCNNGKFRLGYSAGLMFFRENPATRTLWRAKQECGEGHVGPNSEPQYDICIHFSPTGAIEHLSFQKIPQEVEYYDKKEE